jgi:integrase
LTTSEVRNLEELELERESLSRVRDLFLVGIYSGQRFSDYSVFEKADVIGNMIIKKAEKTEHESYIPLHPKLLVILEKYEWNLPRITEQRFNDHIKDICELAGMVGEFKETIYRGNNKETLYHKKFEMVSSHTARRTFITLAAEKGMPDHIIMKITGIRDPKTLLKYKKTSQRAVEDSMNKMWE